MLSLYIRDKQVVALNSGAGQLDDVKSQTVEKVEEI